ncbi:hypothetical protein GMES_3667 [Paraglaciecola mesophila KMM 241]|uniref:Uncharacterized protein n=1 Tax=Paraglaciecola mesophila KMM 241 TaxID=1128912 RepID=K6XZC0_9ALTE|nr:hypothetical protein [Paraglaciecola mesophila]GAC25944.1 hypothetical protein GMES_3667 [Paraglaciecola mesophila KMM 241]
MAIIVNAVQQHRNKVESEKRVEVAKQKNVVDETEEILLATEHITVSQQLKFIFQQRIVNALKIIAQVNPGVMDINSRIESASNKLKELSANQEPISADSFSLPNSDKQVVAYIKCVKKMRGLLRSEYTKGRVDSSAFMVEDKYLERLQLRANVETLMRRGESSMQAQQLGSARQCIEKAITALDSQSQPDDYIIQRKQELELQLKQIQDSLRSANTEDVRKRKESERNELDELFSEKKKW